MIRRLLLALTLLLAPALAAAQDFASDRITVRVEGEGPDVILVPGLTSSPAAWRYTVPGVPGYRYHLVQVKGFAGTAAEGNANGDLVMRSAEEIARYIGVEKLKSPAIVGHSMGGSIAMMIAARRPGSVSRVMVVDMMPWMGAMFGPTVDQVRPIADTMRARMASNADPAGRAKQIGAMTDSMVATESERAGVLKSALDSDPAATAQAYHELLVTDLRPELAAITVPATVLYVTPRGALFSDAQIDVFYRGFYAGLKGAKLIRIPDSAHFIMFDNKDRFHAELKAFLTR